MRYSFFLPPRERAKIERETKKSMRRSEKEICRPSMKRRDRERENATKGLTKREGGREEASVKWDEESVM